jgi:hypothetical protein
MGLPAAATEIILDDQNNGTYGADGNGNSIIAYCDATVLVGGLKLNGVTGYGLLAVKGDLVLGGGSPGTGWSSAPGPLRSTAAADPTPSI